MCKFTQDLMMSFGRAMRDFALPPPPSVPLPSSPPLQNKNHHCTGKTHSLQKTTAIRVSSPFVNAYCIFIITNHVQSLVTTGIKKHDSLYITFKTFICIICHIISISKLAYLLLLIMYNYPCIREGETRPPWVIAPPLHIPPLHAHAPKQSSDYDLCNILMW